MRAIAFLMAVATVLSGMSSLLLNAVADTEPNNDSNTAETITAGRWPGRVNATDTDDFYKFNVPGGNIIAVTLATGTSSANDLNLELLSPTKTSMGTIWNIASGTSKTFSHTTSGTAGAQTYYARVNGGSNTYNITLALTPQNDSGTGGDAPDAITSPPLVPSGVDHTGWIGDDDDDDFFAFQVAAGATFAINFTPGTASTEALDFAIFNPTKDSLQTLYSVNPGVTSSISYTTKGSAGDRTFFLKAGGAGTNPNNYTYRITIIPQNDAGTGKDAGDIITGANPTPVAIGPVIQGYLADEDISDFFNFTVPAGNTFFITMTTGVLTTATLDFYIFSPAPAQTKIASVYDLKPGVTETYLYTAKGSAGDRSFYLEASGGGYENGYTFNISLAAQDDASIGRDAGDALTAPTPAAAGTPFSGLVADEDTDDFFNFTVPAGNTFTVEFTTGSISDASLTFNIYRPDKNNLKSIYSLKAGLTESYSYTTNGAGGDKTYYVHADGNGYRNTYTMKITLTPQNDAGLGKDAGDDLEHTTPLVAGNYTGYLADLDANDYYSVVLGTGQEMNVTLLVGTNTSTALTFTVYSPTKTVVKTIYSIGAGLSGWVRVGPVTAPSTYYMQVGGSGYTNDYSLSVQVFTPPPPPAVVILVPAAGATIEGYAIALSGTVESIAGISKVELSTTNTTYSTWAPATLSGTSWSASTFGTIGSNTVYVRATDIDGRVGYASVAVTVKASSGGGGGGGGPAGPVIATVGKVSSTTAEVNWVPSVMSDFSRYEVYRATKADFSDKVMAANLTSKSTSTYKVTGLKSDTQYYLRVDTVATNGTRYPSAAVQAKTAAGVSGGTGTTTTTSTSSAASQELMIVYILAIVLVVCIVGVAIILIRKPKPPMPQPYYPQQQTQMYMPPP